MSDAVVAFRFRAAGGDPVALYLGGLALSAQRTMGYKLKQAARYFGFQDPRQMPWADLRYEHAVEYRNHLTGRGLKPKTVNNALAALIGVARECYKLELMTAEQYYRIRDIKKVKGETIPPGRALTEAEVEGILRACLRDPKRVTGSRDAAIFGILFGTGVRCFELFGLRVEDYDAATGELLVNGKGNCERIVYVPDETAALLARWLMLRGNAPGPLFMGVTSEGKIIRSDTPMTTGAMQPIINKRCREADVKRFTPHDARRTFISDLLDKTEVGGVQLLAGHKDPKTTMKYDRKSERRKKAAAALVRVPYKMPAPEDPAV